MPGWPLRSPCALVLPPSPVTSRLTRKTGSLTQYPRRCHPPSSTPQAWRSEAGLTRAAVEYPRCAPSPHPVTAGDRGAAPILDRRSKQQGGPGGNRPPGPPVPLPPEGSPGDPRVPRWVGALVVEPAELAADGAAGELDVVDVHVVGARVAADVAQQRGALAADTARRRGDRVGQGGRWAAGRVRHVEEQVVGGVELAADGAAGEVGGVDVHVVVARVGGDRVDHRGVGRRAAGDRVQGVGKLALEEQHDDAAGHAAAADVDVGGDRGGDARPLQQEAGLAVGEPDEGASGAVGIARAGYLLRAVEGGGEQGGLVAGGGGPRGDQRGQPEGEGDGDGGGERASAHSAAPFGRPTRGDTGTTIEGAVRFPC